MEAKIIDTHTHLNFNAFKNDRDEVVERTLKENVWMVNVGTQFDTSRTAVEMAGQYSDGVYAAVGLHPIHIFESFVDEEEDSFQTRGEKFDLESYRELALRSTKVVAIGEFGLDYYRMPEGVEEDEVKRLQEEVVAKHLELAKEIDKPVMIHCRDAYEDMILLLKNHYDGKGIIHSYTGTWDQLQPFLERNFLVGLNGIITFDKTGRAEGVIKNTPLERMVLETDAPYLTPEPHRGKRNEPLYTKHVAKKVAEFKNISVEEVEERTTKNAREIFKI
ncbi:MAG: hydrolase TatD [Candidatus Magasanikbacteria bacterium CG10_big_fil_rev_8_21_14_0_10_40_10]|uniref:Hydrolase TatD n=1 Tax=Candidatus Magasanikbacteria bacterium CG10_big_fil_rev_8_21_14_0_10_40_10 TaxID=1974648 RepID=A0A2M6W2K8_9BACT|nr:MAG: hydrolase TatD [Candidatus Magasanikbacteria bacterium CG10_big_fil_rev_8_21_14_0_10_40_10]